MAAFQQQNYTLATTKCVLFSKLYKSSTADEAAAKRIDEMVGEVQSGACVRAHRCPGSAMCRPKLISDRKA